MKTVPFSKLKKKTFKITNKREQNKNNKVLGITLNKQVKNLYNRNVKTLRKVTDEDPRRQKYLLHSYFGNIKTVEKAILTEAMNLFNAVPLKIIT